MLLAIAQEATITPERKLRVEAFVENTKSADSIQYSDEGEADGAYAGKRVWGDSCLDDCKPAKKLDDQSTSCQYEAYWQQILAWCRLQRKACKPQAGQGDANATAMGDEAYMQCIVQLLEGVRSIPWFEEVL